MGYTTKLKMASKLRLGLWGHTTTEGVGDRILIDGMLYERLTDDLTGEILTDDDSGEALYDLVIQ